MTLGLSGTRDEKTMQQPFCSVYANHQLSARILTTSKKPHKLQYNIFRTINRYEYVGKPRGHGHPVMAMLRKKNCGAICIDLLFSFRHHQLIGQKCAMM